MQRFTQSLSYFYRKYSAVLKQREASLTAVETFCVEVIHALNNPTIKEFANFCNDISGKRRI